MGIGELTKRSAGLALRLLGLGVLIEGTRISLVRTIAAQLARALGVIGLR
jgi:hypothetical protein